MSQPFTFPPPPPPPPKRDQPAHLPGLSSAPPSRAGPGSRGAPRGRFQPRGFRAGSRGHGLRHGYSRGASTGSARALSATWTGGHPNDGHGSSRSDEHATPPAFLPPAKRDHGSAFGAHIQRTSRPKAPPAVPSFNADIDSLLNPPAQLATSGARPASKKTNLLGLTPGYQDSASESASEGESDEVRLVHFAAAGGDELTFEHKGQTLSLRTPDEIAAWVAERRKKFPTQAKADAAKKEAEEKRRKWEESKKVRDEALKQRKEERDAQRHDREKLKVKEKLLAQVTAKAKAAVAANKSTAADEARRRAEKLRKKAERATRELKEAEEALEKAQTDAIKKDEGGTLADTETSPVKQSVDVLPVSDPPVDETGYLVEDSVDLSSDSDASEGSNVEDTSSSGSSDSGSDVDSDSGPEEESSKRTGPERVPPPRPSAKVQPEEQPLCRNLVKFGKCKFGRKCRYSHSIPNKNSAKQDARQSQTRGQRKGLYQIMVEREQEEEHKHVLRAIIALGKQGLLD